MAKRKKKKQKNRKSSARSLKTHQATKAALSEPFDLESQREQLMRESSFLMTSLAGKAESREQLYDVFVGKIFATDEMAEAPEFKSVYFHPAKLMKVFSEQLESFVPSSQHMGNFTQEQTTMMQLQVIEKCIRELLTPEHMQEILTALYRYKNRIRGVLGAKKVALAAAMLLILGDDKEAKTWSNVGLVRGIFQKSLAVGMEFQRIVKELKPEYLSGTHQLPTDDIPEEKLAQMGQPVFDSQPGLMEFFQNQFESGEKSFYRRLINGDIDLDIYSQEQLHEGGFIIARGLGVDLNTGDLPKEDFGEEKVKRMVKDLEAFILDQTTDSWLDGVIEKLSTVIMNKDLNLAFEDANSITMIRETLRKRRDVREKMSFFIFALLGETQKLAQSNPNEQE